MQPRTDTTTPPANRPVSTAPSRSGVAGRWSSEQVLASRDTEQGVAAGPAAAGARHERLIPIERAESPGLRAAMRRAVAVPLLAGGAVFVIAVLIAVTTTVLQSNPGAAAATSIEQELRATAETSGDDSTGTSGGSAGDAGAGDGGSVIYVHVIGEVAASGVVEVPSGARIADVIAAAGGATDAAVLNAVNLAREAVDGEQLLVPNAEQAEAAQMPEPALDSGAGAAGQGSAGTVDLNAASSSELETLPRVGPALAQRIIDWREANGGFSGVEQLLEVSGIGAKTFEGLRDRVSVK